MQKNSIDKYLLSYAERESHEIDLASEVYDYVIVIPICDESNDCLDTIFSEIDKSLSVLLVLVVNSPALISKSNFKINNSKFINNLLTTAHLIQSASNNVHFLKFDGKFDTILVDRNSDGLQLHEKSGVGLARKIGSDIALKFYQKGKIKQPWIFSTDADVILPEHYFTQVHHLNSDYSAVVLDFEHISNDGLLNRLQYYYDVKIRYYQAGVSYAGSAYNYIPLGSTLISNMSCYAQVRGFPKKNAGEDFYLLNKLVKIKPIAYKTNHIKIKIRSRFSARVPFGTGPALMHLNNLNSIDDYMYYHPKCFILLKQWMVFLESMWSENQLTINPPESDQLLQLYQFFKCQLVFEKSQPQITSKLRWTQFVHQWFDAFKTLKAVHYFDKNLGKLTLKQLLKSPNFAKVCNPSLKSILNSYDKN